uniref:ABC transporter family protein n=1 Tax=Trepomonas sp. PC1 TaxID=1076344 RepID=A0A146KAC5_9EUKA|eukprot:JAP92349.1 ABC transporter family protein [Trepomonas sp. PC1]
MASFKTNFETEFQLTPDKYSYQSFASKAELDEYLQKEKGRVVYGINAPDLGELQIYSRDKKFNLTLQDSDLQSSSFVRFYTVLEKTFSTSPSPIKLDIKLFNTVAQQTKQIMVTTMLQSFSVVYMLQLISILVVFTKLHDHRQYEYLIVSGLNRVQYFMGILVYVIIELIFTSFVVAISFCTFNVLQTTNDVNFFAPFFILPQAVSYCFGFSFFSFALFNNPAAIMIFVTMLGFFPGVVLSFLGPILDIKGVWYKVLTAIVQIVLPGSGVTVGFSTMSKVAVLQNCTFKDIMLQSGESYYPLLVNMFLGYLSLAVYTIFGFILDKIRKSAHHPTSDHLFAKKEAQLEDNKLIVDNLCITFKSGRGAKQKVVEAIKNMNIEFTKHQSVVGVVAQNGGGKTTLFRTILGSQRPTSGQVTLGGRTPGQFSMNYYRQLSVVFQENIIFSKFTVMDTMTFMANVMGENVSKDQIMNYLRQMGIENTANQVAEKLSGGQQRRLQIAVTMLRQSPQLRIYDEPACGVDIESRKFLWVYLKQKQNCLTLLTTHIMEEAEELCDDIVMIKEGKLVAHGSLLFVKEHLSAGYELSFSQPKEQLQEQLKQVEVEQEIFSKKQRSFINVPIQNYQLVIKLMKAFKDVQVICPSLTEVFLKVSEEWEGEPMIE